MAPPTGSGPSPDQVEIAAKLKSLFDSMASSSAALERSLESQAESTRKMVDAMSELKSSPAAEQLTQINETLKLIADAVQQLSSAFQGIFAIIINEGGKAASATNGISAGVGKIGQSLGNVKPNVIRDLTTRINQGRQGTEKFGDKVEKVTKQFKEKFAPAIGAVTGALSGLKKGFENFIAMGSSILGFLGTVAETIADIGFSILSLPFKMFDKLIDMANKYMNQITPLQEAINNIRKEFGTLAGPIASTIQGTARQMQGFKDSGLSAFKVFGDLADRTKLMTEVMTQGGPAVRKFGKEFDEAGGAILGLQKGLGLSNEELGALATRAVASGLPLTRVLSNVTKQAAEMGRQFNIDVKTISKSMAKAMSDARAFGNVSDKAIAAAAVQAERLGISLDKVTASLDNFQTFDQAAENVSKFNEVFGTSVDAMAMMNAETPMEQMEMVRKELAKVGIQGEKLSRVHRSLIQQTMGWDDATQIAAFSTSNYANSLSDVNKAADENEAKTMTQEEALIKLADGMDKFLKSMEVKEGGFFDKFLEGFTDGIQYSKDFRELLANIKMSLINVYWAGRRLGLLFIESFPGMKKIVDGLTAIFNPKHFSNLANGVTNIILEFFHDLESGKASFPALMQRLKDKFFNFFDKSAPGGRRFLEGLKTFGIAFSTILGQGLSWAMETLTQFLRDVVGFIRNPTQVPGVGDIGAAAVTFITPISEAFRASWPAFASAFSDLMTLAFESLGNWFMTKALPLIEPYYPVIAAILFGPALIQSMVGAFAGVMVSVMTQGIAMAATRTAAMAASGALGGVLQKLSGTLGGIMGKSSAIPQPRTPLGRKRSLIPDIGSGTGDALKNLEIKVSWSTILKFVAGFAMFMAIGTLAFAAIVAIASQYEPQTVLAGAAVMMAIMGAMVIGAGAMWIISKIKVDPASLAAGLLTLGIGMVALVGIGFLIGALVSAADPAKLLMGAAVIAAIAAAAIVASIAMVGLMAVGAILVFTGGAGIGALVAGLVAMGVVIYALVELGRFLVDQVKKAQFTPEEIKNSALALGLIAATMIVAMMSLLAFIAVGTVMMGTLGAAYIALEVGIETVEGALEDLVGLAEIIVREAKKIPDGTEQKVDALSNMIGNIAKLTAAFPGMFTALKLEDIDDGGTRQKLLEIVNDIIKDTFNKLESLIRMVVDLSVRIGYSPEAAKGVEILSKAMDAAAKVAQAMTSGAALNLKDVDYSSAPYVVNIVEQVTKNFRQMKDILREFVKELVDIINDPKIRDFSGNPAVISAFGSMLSGLASIITAASAPGLVKAFEKIDKSDFEKLPNVIDAMNRYTTGVIQELGRPGGILDVAGSQIKKIISSVTYVDSSAIQALSAVTNVLNSVFEFIFKLIDTTLSGKTPDDAAARDALKFIKDISGVVTEILKSLGEVLPSIIKSLGPAIAAIGQLPGGKFDLNINTLRNVFALMSQVGAMTFDMPRQMASVDQEAMVSLVESVKKVSRALDILNKEFISTNDFQAFIAAVNVIGSKFTNIGDVNKKLEVTIGAFDVITAASRAASALKNYKRGGIEVDDVETIIEQFRAMGQLFVLLATPEVAGELFEGMIKVGSILSTSNVEYMIGILESTKNFMNSLSTNAPEINAALVTLAGQDFSNISAAEPAFGNIEAFMNTFAKHADLFQNITDKALYAKATVAEGLIPAVEAVEMMVEAAGRLNSALDKGLRFDIDTKLKTFTSKFGKTMGSQAAYKVQAKDVNINVNFRIAIDGGELEKIIVTNPKSIIKQRLNMLINAMPKSTGGDATGLLASDREGARLRTNIIPLDYATYDY